MVIYRSIGGKILLFNYHLVYLIFVEVFVLSAANASIPLYGYKELDHQYGSLGYYCWILQPTAGRGHTTGFVMRFVTRYGQSILVFIFNTILYFRLYKYISQLSLDLKENVSSSGPSASDRAKATVRKFMWYPSECI